MKMGKIFYLMGKSASGKDSIYKRLRSLCPELKSIVLYTTRPMRDGEQEGVEYHFIGQKQLKKLEQSGKVVEVRTYQTVFGQWSYATVDDGVRLERAIARERQQQEPKYTELCRRFLADEADFSPERLAELDVTEAFENQELEACVQAIADRIWRETGK